jgi:GNAT superfamily N-acetyltransferase
MAWGRGWAVSRGVPPPTDIPGGFRADVGRPGHRVRYVLHTWDADLLSSLGRQAAAPGTWIKVTGPALDLRSVLPPRWTVDGTGYLMSAPFRAGVEDPPAPYEIQVKTVGEAIVATVVDAAGATAAAGRLAPAGELGVIDQVETAPAHRRRGLGRAVLQVLSDHAARTGMSTGVLVATDEGRRLYQTLGWSLRSKIAAAFVPEN